MINSEDHIIEVLKVAHLLNNQLLFGNAANFVHENFENLEKTEEWKNFVNENSDSYKEFVRYILYNRPVNKAHFFSE